MTTKKSPEATSKSTVKIQDLKTRKDAKGGALKKSGSLSFTTTDTGDILLTDSSTSTTKLGY